MHPLLHPGRHPVVGHRGAAGSAPENTLAALDFAVADGAEALEFDVRVAADGVPVLLHDPLLDRTTDASGPLAGRSSADLATLDAGYRFSPEGGAFPWRARGAGVPSLREVLERYPFTPLLVELKVVEAAEPVRRLLLEHGAEDRTIIASFLEGALRPFRDAAIPTAASRRGITALWLRTLVGLRASRIPDRVYAVPDRYRDRLHVPTPRFIRAAQRAGYPVHVWTVDDPARAAVLWRRGACGMITNFPGRLLAERNRLFPAEAGTPGA
jgi:glycerophosphoryl diester phosphodiesterase